MHVDKFLSNFLFEQKWGFVSDFNLDANFLRLIGTVKWKGHGWIIKQTKKSSSKCCDNNNEDIIF